MKPKEAEAPGATVPFQPAFFAVTAVPVWAKLAFHICPTVWPGPKVQPSVQPVQGVVEVLAKVTSAWKPPGSENAAPTPGPRPGVVEPTGDNPAGRALALFPPPCTGVAMPGPAHPTAAAPHTAPAAPAYPAPYDGPRIAAADSGSETGLRGCLT